MAVAQAVTNDRLMAKPLTPYAVRGPFKVPARKVGAGRTVATDKLDDFWNKTGKVARAYGCYVFCMTHGKHVVPWWVGQASKKFKTEAFTPHKLNVYTEVLLEKPKQQPVIFFVMRTPHKGKHNAVQITQIENWLIAAAYQVNPRLKNKKKIPRERWAITGVIRRGAGKPSVEAKAFRKSLEIGA